MAEEEILSTEALMAANETLAEKIAASNPSPSRDTSPAPKRGRPPGSRNRGTVKPDMLIPPGASPKANEGPTAEQKAASKKRRATELSNKIAEELNENLMSIFMALGVPADLLYKPGMAPQAKKVSSKYTDLGNQLALGPMQSETFGRFMAELEATEFGGKATAMVSGDSKLPLVLYGVLSIGAGLQYAKGVKEVMDRIGPIMQAKAAYEAQEAKNKKGGQDGQ